jgi:NADH-quinone oxidoreductase subunit E
MKQTPTPSSARGGLCTTCSKAEDCTLSSQKDTPVIFCEEFEELVEIGAKKILEKHNGKKGSIIAILEDIQSKYSYLPQEALRLVAKETERSLTEIYGVATFYRSFKLKPRGKHLISVCLGTACHVRGAPRVAEEFQKQLHIHPGETTEDRMFTLETVNCLGACALGPVVVADGHYFPGVNSRKVVEILNKTIKGLDGVEIETDKRVFPISVSCSRCNHSLMDSSFLIDGFPSIRITQSFGQQHGWLRLSSLYGSYRVEAEFEVPANGVAQFFCPHCHTELLGGSNCPECGTLMVPMIVREGGIAQICPRRGCRGHMLDIA